VSRTKARVRPYMSGFEWNPDTYLDEMLE